MVASSCWLRGELHVEAVDLNSDSWSQSTFIVVVKLNV
jgi:hypothetical protein